MAKQGNIKPSNTVKKRIIFLMITFTIIIIGLVTRVAFIQIVNGEIQAGFEMLTLCDKPIDRNIQTMIRRHPVSVASAVFRT